MDQKQKARQRSSISKLVREGLPTWEREVLQAIPITVVVVIALLGTYILLYVVSLISGRTVYDLLKVLAVPIALGAAVPLLNWLQKKRELDIEHERAEDEALQAYVNQMSDRLADKGRPLQNLHNNQEDNDLSTVVRAQTYLVLRKLNDGKRKGLVVQFLHELRLICADGPPVIRLTGSNLRKAKLKGVDLTGADLSGCNLSGANLRGTDLNGAKLRAAKLGGADLSEAKVSLEQLAQARSLEGATMPDGQILRGDKTPNNPTFEDWLNDKEIHGEREANPEDS